MGKVSIGLRGWRFEEANIFTDEGEYKPPDQIPPADRKRLARLPILTTSPCHACWLIHGDEAIDRCNLPAVVWGEPLSEVVLCVEHESDFLFWFSEEGGKRFAGKDGLQDEFFGWFENGGRAPPEYEGIEHVDTDPGSVPDPTPPDPKTLAMDPPPDGRRIDLREFDPERRYPRKES